MSGPPVLALTGVSVGYAERPAVRDVDLRLDAGEVVALVGPNGSGKTTLVRGVLGLADVLAGQVDLFGTPAREFKQRWRIGYVPQRHTVVGAVPSTVTEVVASGLLARQRLWARTTRSDRDRIAAAIATVGLTEQRSAPVGTLSGGQQRRVLIARALVAEPDVLVMDEPTAGVDAQAQERLVDTLETLVAKGLTLLVVTHEVAPLRRVLTRVVALRDGRVVQDVPAEQVFGSLVGGSSGGAEVFDGPVHEHAHHHDDVDHTHPHRHGPALQLGAWPRREG